MIASILAANMSTCSAFLVDSGALFTEGLYRRRLAPDRPDQHYLWVGRISGSVITMLGVVYALFLIESVLYTFLLTETLATFVGISILGGVMWRRANRWGALASLLSALATNFLLYYLTGQRLDYWDPNVFLASLVVGTMALVVVSLMTRPEPSGAIESFFERLQTPSDDDTAEAGLRRRTPGPSGPLVLVNLLRLRHAAAGQGWQVFREDLGGFLVGFALVLLLVAATALLLAP
jgi:Na+/proline symporter